MSFIQRDTLPEHALLRRHAHGGAYADCYSTEVRGSVSHAEYVEAFFTTAVFRLERLLLAWLVARPSSDSQARRLAAGELDSFAAWSVEARAVDQLLMADFRGRTRLWLMVAPVEGVGAAATRLYLGSAIVPIVNEATGAATLGFTYRALLGFHKLYSRVLLRAARSRLARSARQS